MALISFSHRQLPTPKTLPRTGGAQKKEDSPQFATFAPAATGTSSYADRSTASGSTSNGLALAAASIDDVDSMQVAAIKDAIKTATYVPNPAKTAAGLLRSVQELLGV